MATLTGSVPTHKQMNARLRTAGRRAATRALKAGGMLPTQANPAGHKEDYFRNILQKADMDKVVSATQFNDLYRGLWGEMDELVSTSSVREIVFGVLGEKSKLTMAQRAEVNRALNEISKIRLPTKLVGYSLSSTNKMQHPTAAGAGYFAEAAQTASAHSQHDRARKAYVVSEIEKAMTGNWDIRDVARAAIKASIAYTLNEMAAPVTAENVHEHSLKKSETKVSLKHALAPREAMKRAFVVLGGTQDAAVPNETPAQSLRRPWNRAGLRTVSPARAAA